MAGNVIVKSFSFKNRHCQSYVISDRAICVCN